MTYISHDDHRDPEPSGKGHRGADRPQTLRRAGDHCTHPHRHWALAFPRKAVLPGEAERGEQSLHRPFGGTKAYVCTDSEQPPCAHSPRVPWTCEF